MSTKIDLQPFAQRLIVDLELAPDVTSTPRELLAKARLKLEAIKTDDLSQEAKDAHRFLGVAFSVLRNAAPEEVSAAFKAAIENTLKNRPGTSALLAEFNAAVAREMNLKKMFSVGGERFDDEAKARKLATGIAIIKAFADLEPVLGDDVFSKLKTGKVYLKHAPKDVAAAREKLLEVAKEYWGEDARAAVADVFAGKIMRDAAQPLKDAITRLINTTKDGKEVGYSTFLQREGMTPIAASPSLLAFAIPKKGVPEPALLHVDPKDNDRAVEIGRQAGDRAERLAFARLEKQRQFGPLDATYGPKFGELLGDTILALHGERLAKAFEEKRWAQLIKGLEENKTAEYVKLYVEWAEADVFEKFDSLTVGNIAPRLEVTERLLKVQGQTGPVDDSVYAQLRQELLDIEAGATMATHVRTVKTGQNNAIFRLGAWAGKMREELEERQTTLQASA